MYAIIFLLKFSLKGKDSGKLTSIYLVPINKYKHLPIHLREYSLQGQLSTSMLYEYEINTEIFQSNFVYF